MTTLLSTAIIAAREQTMSPYEPRPSAACRLPREERPLAGAPFEPPAHPWVRAQSPLGHHGRRCAAASQARIALHRESPAEERGVQRNRWWKLRHVSWVRFYHASKSRSLAGTRLNRSADRQGHISRRVSVLSGAALERTQFRHGPLQAAKPLRRLELQTQQNLALTRPLERPVELRT